MATEAATKLKESLKRVPFTSRHRPGSSETNTWLIESHPEVTHEEYKTIYDELVAESEAVKTRSLIFMNRSHTQSTGSKRSAQSDATYVTAPTTRATANNGDGNPTSAFDVDGTTTNVEVANLRPDLLEKLQLIFDWVRMSNRLTRTEQSVGTLDMVKEITEVSEALAPKVAKRKLQYERYVKDKENASSRASKRWKKELENLK